MKPLTDLLREKLAKVLEPTEGAIDFNDFDRGAKWLAEEYAPLHEKMLACVEALESISSLFAEEHAQEEAWMKIPHERCALTLAQDTAIAREALAALRAECGECGE